MNLVIFDIDGILAKLTPLQETLLEGRETKYRHLTLDDFWHRYYADIIKQKPIRKFEHLLQQLFPSNGNFLVILTSRCELYRGPTEQWLYFHFLNKLGTLTPPYQRLIMRPVYDHRPGEKVKADTYKALFKKRVQSIPKLLYGENKIEKTVAFEDCPRVIKAYRELGIKVFTDKCKAPKRWEEVF